MLNAGQEKAEMSTQWDTVDSRGVSEDISTPSSVRSLHVDDLGFQSATPELVFDKIFSYLSPAYLHHFCRRVCKSWKEFIDQRIAEYLAPKTLLQLIMYNEYGNTKFDSPVTSGTLRLHSAIYGASSYDPVTDIVTFTPPGGCQPYTTTGSNISRRGRKWSLLDIISSLFPSPEKHRMEKDYHEFIGQRDYVNPTMYLDMKAILYEHTHLYSRENGEYLSKRQIDEFNARSPSTNRTNPALIDEVLDFCAWEFEFPQVYVDLEVHEYLLKCRFLTELSSLDMPRQPTNRRWTLFIDSIETKLSKLLQWNCACSSTEKEACPIENLLATPETRFGGKRTVFVPGCPSLALYENRIYKDSFAFFPSQNRPFWRKFLASHVGDPATSSFIPQEVDLFQRNRNALPKLPCAECVEVVANGGFGTNSRTDGDAVLWASGRCAKKLCGRCCVNESCKGHGSCVVCRQKRVAVHPALPDERVCLEIFGVPCKKIPQQRKANLRLEEVWGMNRH